MEQGRFNSGSIAAP